MRLMVKVLSVVCLIGLGATIAGAQGSATGDLHVTVKDPSGKVVTNATVTLRDPVKGLERTTTQNTDGEYRLLALPPGRYSVSVSASGFSKEVVQDQAVTVGQMADLPVMLQVSGGETIVNVGSEAELVETARTSTTDTIDQRRIDNLPINGRNYINFTLTDSQVVRDNAPSVGAAPTSGLNMSGQRGRANLVNVDGADAIDNGTNGVRSTVSQEAVQEFQILTNGYAAEYGRASGGVVNIITRSGTNDFHGDVYSYIRNRNFQAVNPFSTTRNPAYTRVQAGVAFGGPIRKDKTYYYFSYEVTRRHETGFSSIGRNNFDLVPFDTSTTAGGALPLPFGTIQVTNEQKTFLGPGLGQIASQNPTLFFKDLASKVPGYEFLVGASSGMAVRGEWPTGFTGGVRGIGGFPSTCQSPPCFIPASYQTLASQSGNYPVFEGTSLYSLRLDHNLATNNRIMLRANVSPSTVTGIQVNGENQVFGQNAYSRTSQDTHRDLAGVVEDSWAIGNNRVNEFRFQYARRGRAYFYSSAPSGSTPAVNLLGYAFIGREPYSYIQEVEKRFQFTDNFSWTRGRHDTKLGVDFNHIPVTAGFTVNYGGVYDFGSFSAYPTPFPALNPVQAYGAGVPGTYIQGIGNPNDKFTNQPLGLFWQDSWRARSNLTVNYGMRYDIEFPPQFAPPTGLGLAAYNQLGLQKGIHTDRNNFQPRIGVAWDPWGGGKSVIRASYGVFFDHPLLGLYFLGDASDGSRTTQLAFAGTGFCTGAGQPGNLNAIPIFQGLINNPVAPQCAPGPAPLVAALGYDPNHQTFDSFLPNSLFINQNYITAGFPLIFQPFGYPQAKNFVYAYSQQANLAFEHELGKGLAMSLGYNFNGGRHLNRPINANAPRGDLLVRNWQAAYSDPSSYATVGGPLGVGLGPSSQGFLPCNINPNNGQPWVAAALVNFFRPSGLNPAIANAMIANSAALCVGLAQQMLQAEGLNAACNPATLADCVPFLDMDANFSNGSSVYHGFSANLRKRFGGHTEFLASYTWSHAIDDSTDLQSPLAPQDSYYPGLERSNSLFDQRHRFVFSGVYQTGRVAAGAWSTLLSNWTFSPIIEFSSGRPFNILTGNGTNLQDSSFTTRPSVLPAGATTNACGQPVTPVASKFSPTGFLAEACYSPTSNTTLLSLDGTLGRNAGLTPWTVFNDLRIARRVYFGERINLELMADVFNLANRFNVSAVNQLWTNAGQPTATYDPRQFQFALKLNW